MRAFDPSTYRVFTFQDRDLDETGHVRLSYGLDDEYRFIERFDLPTPTAGAITDLELVADLLALLHWVVGVSYYKTAAPPEVAFADDVPPPATGALLEAFYSEGLGEFAYVNELEHLPRPRFAEGPASPTLAQPSALPRRVLVPVGGGRWAVARIQPSCSRSSDAPTWRCRCSRSATHRRSPAR